jgi:hypothetical protein
MIKGIRGVGNFCMGYWVYWKCGILRKSLRGGRRIRQHHVKSLSHALDGCDCAGFEVTVGHGASEPLTSERSV